MIHTVVKNVVRESTEGRQVIGNVYLTGAAEIELRRSKIPNMQPVDVRGFIDHRYSSIDNVYGCLKIAQEIEEALRNGKNPVVFCDGGLERSPLAIAVWLSWMHNITLEFAYEMIEKNQPGIFRRIDWVRKRG